MQTESNVIELNQPTLEDKIKEALEYRKQANTTIPLEAEIRVGELFVQLRLESDSKENFVRRGGRISELGSSQIYQLLKLGVHAAVVREAAQNDGVDSVRKAYALVKDLPDPEGYEPPQKKRGRKPGSKNKVKKTGWKKEARKVGLIPPGAGGGATKKLREEVESRLGYSVPPQWYSEDSQEAEDINDVLLDLSWEKNTEVAKEDADRLESTLSATAKKRFEKAVAARVAVETNAFMLDAKQKLDKVIKTKLGARQKELDAKHKKLEQREFDIGRRERAVQKLLNGVVVGLDDLNACFKLLKQVAHPDKFNGKAETAEKAMDIIRKLESALVCGRR